MENEVCYGKLSDEKLGEVGLGRNITAFFVKETAAIPRNFSSWNNNDKNFWDKQEGDFK